MLVRHLTRIRRNISTTTSCYRRRNENVLVDQPLDIPLGDSDMNNKSRVSFLSQDMQDTDRVGIRGLSSVGFRMYDDSFLYGPIAVFPTVALSWRVAQPSDITHASLKLFLTLQPPLDILVLGVGDRKNIDAVRSVIAPTLREHRVGLEIAPTEDAVPTFNFLNSEYRYVAGGFFPPAELTVSVQQNVRSLSRIQPYDTIVENPFSVDPLLGNHAHEVIYRIFGRDQNGRNAIQEVERIRLQDRQSKLDRIREHVEQLDDKARSAYLTEKKRIRAALEDVKSNSVKIDDK